MMLFLVVLLAAHVRYGSCQETGSSGDKNKPKIGIAEDMGEAARKEAAKLREDIEEQARSLFDREPLGWDAQTAKYLYSCLLYTSDAADE